MSGLSWNWIAVMAVGSPLLGLLVAYPIWRTRQAILGNLAGSAAIFGVALALILRESVEIERVTRECLEAGFTCWPAPSAFVRYAIYAGLGMIQVFALFIFSLSIEEKMRRQGYAPEWR